MCPWGNFADCLSEDYNKVVNGGVQVWAFLHAQVFPFQRYVWFCGLSHVARISHSKQHVVLVCYSVTGFVTRRHRVASLEGLIAKPFLLFVLSPLVSIKLGCNHIKSSNPPNSSYAAFIYLFIA